MRRLKNDRIVGVSASSVMDNYDADYLLDEHPSRLWRTKIGVNNATLTFDIQTGFSDLMIFGTNAESAIVTVSDPNYIEFGYADDFGYSGDEFANTTDGESQTITTTTNGNALHVLLDTPVTFSSVVVVQLSASGGLYAGKAIADIAETYGGRNPFYGMSRGKIDRSIQNEYPRYYSKRETPSVWSVETLLANADANQFMKDFDTYGEMNSGWKITDRTGAEYLCYGYVSNPQEGFNFHSYRSISFNLNEVK